MTMYAYKESGRWVFPVAMRSRFGGVGAFHTLSDDERAQYGWYPFQPDVYHYNSRYQDRFGPFNVRLEDGVVKADYIIRDKNLDTVKDRKRESLRDERVSHVASPIQNLQVGRLEDRENIKEAVANWDKLSKNPDGTKTWIMADNSPGSVTKEQLESVIDEYVTRQDNAFVAYGQALMALAEASNVEEVEAIELFPEEEE